ncbi:MAG: GNAT family N-acetyltransferase [Paraglaciecola sp.]|uniref:GNAT family N-acetyltransferase n=1 Tax=Paraglaciecola sp. TaxID=1920173 RepID=UPI00273D8C70|nr:GNAT family N-acetyltransferase [Paraglaciecola sp.]MDP5031255.1 GNAT family N-acetyltransferase [Paraglaciecola sp.]MDP5132861.1 GNAT family N-acetyltransferase [Paraglaciecola sp.]
MPSQATSNPDFRIRSTTIEDSELILQFIRELAEYEKLLHEVVTDVATLQKNLFGEIQHAKAVIGEYKGQPVAFALYFYNFSTFTGKPGIYLEDLYVKPTARGHGFGKMLLAYLAKLAKEKDCARLEWWVLDWNTPAIDFYRSLGAQPMDEWTVNRVSGPNLDKLAQLL